MNRTRTLLAALIALAALAVPAWSAAGAAPCTPSLAPNAVLVGPTGNLKVKFTAVTCGAVHWDALDDAGLIYVNDELSMKETFGAWLENADAGPHQLTVRLWDENGTVTSFRTVVVLGRAYRVVGGALQRADWDTNRWAAVSSPRSR